jgi:hypothetical protein
MKSPARRRAAAAAPNTDDRAADAQPPAIGRREERFG